MLWAWWTEPLNKSWILQWMCDVKTHKGRSCWHRATSAICLCLLAAGVNRGKERGGTQKSMELKLFVTADIWSSTSQNCSKQGQSRQQPCNRLFHLIYYPASASTQEYMRQMLLQGMHCSHPDKIADPILIPAVAGKESIFIYSYLPFFLSATSFPSTPSYLSSLHWILTPSSFLSSFPLPPPQPQHWLPPLCQQ